MNPEHPPFAKLVATLPLLPLGLPVQPARNIWFRAAASSRGLQFLYSHDADAILFRARAGASIFAIGLALVVFFATREMFGDGAALLALLVLVFEPVILANGALVTTDMGVTACLFAAVYLFYRYIRRPSISRLIFCGVVTGLALGAKHSALIILPTFVVLAAGEILLGRAARKLPESEEPGNSPRLTRPPAGWRTGCDCRNFLYRALVVLWVSFRRAPTKWSADSHHGSFPPRVQCHRSPRAWPREWLHNR